jgi:hypothetical protein
MSLIKFSVFQIFLLSFLFTHGQQISVSDSLSNTKILLRKEQSGFAMIHTSGFGFGYRNGTHITGYKKRMFEFEITGMKNPKEIRVSSLYPSVQGYPDPKSYIYGKENAFFILRGGIGKQKIINSKPYWGGVELRYFYYGGLSLGILKPIYLYIYDLQDTLGNPISIQRYNPAIHTADNIYGRAPFFEGFNKISLMPGIYFKTGLNFEYGASDKTLKAIEAGIAVDIYTKDVPIMAYTNNKNYFVSLYLSFHLGSRGN